MPTKQKAYQAADFVSDAPDYLSYDTALAVAADMADIATQASQPTTGRNIKCVECGKRFPHNARGLRHHMRDKHGKKGEAP